MMMETDNLALWYSMRAKILYKEAEKYYEQFRYPMSIFSSQESIEFSLKAILRLHNVSYRETHEISRSLNKLANKLEGEFREEIIKAAGISATWLGESRNFVRFGLPASGNFGILPEEFEIFDKNGAKTALNAAEEVLTFLYAIEKKDKYPIRIGILNGYVSEPEKEKKLDDFYRVHNSFNVGKWKECFSDEIKYKVDEIMASKIDNRYQIIINPFGEIYPEIDLETKPVYGAIKEYIYHGGIFVNAGGFPFYWGWDVKGNKKKDFVEMIPYYTLPDANGNFRVYKDIKPFWTSLLWQDFGVTTTADTEKHPKKNRYKVIELRNPDNNTIWIKKDVDGDDYVREFRAIIAKKGNKNIIPLLQVKRPDFGNVYPISAIKYGRGFLFLGSMDIQTDSEFEKLVEGLKNFCDWVLNRET
ncbi:MAG: HEPN domain-containing protein [Methanophagales archaeon]|nr:HEPN domain-containing protein [Methanophagales archaeon]